MARQYQRESAEFGRALGLFDGVYGFALTLLVANIDPPKAEHWESLDALFSNGFAEQLTGFFLAFIAIAVMWRTNHRVISKLNTMTPPVLMANIIALVFVVFIPFSSQGVSDGPILHLPLPTALFALNIALAFVAQYAIYLTGARTGDLHEPEPAHIERARALFALSIPTVFLMSIPLAFLTEPFIARLSWLLCIPIVWWSLSRLRRLQREAHVPLEQP